VFRSFSHFEIWCNICLSSSAITLYRRSSMHLTMPRGSRNPETHRRRNVPRSRHEVASLISSRRRGIPKSNIDLEQMLRRRCSYAVARYLQELKLEVTRDNVVRALNSIGRHGVDRIEFLKFEPAPHATDRISVWICITHVRRSGAVQYTRDRHFNGFLPRKLRLSGEGSGGSRKRDKHKSRRRKRCHRHAKRWAA
jgi:hypothetical protein